MKNKVRLLNMRIPVLIAFSLAMGVNVGLADEREDSTSSLSTSGSTGLVDDTIPGVALFGEPPMLDDGFGDGEDNSGLAGTVIEESAAPEGPDPRCSYMGGSMSLQKLGDLRNLIYGSGACLSDDPRERTFCGALNSAQFADREGAERSIRADFSPLYIGELRQHYRDAAAADGNPTNLADLISRLRGIIRSKEQRDDQCRIDRFLTNGSCTADFQSDLLDVTFRIIRGNLTRPIAETIESGANLSWGDTEPLQSLIEALYRECRDEPAQSIRNCWQREDALTILFEEIVQAVPGMTTEVLTVSAEDRPEYAGIPVDGEARERVQYVKFTDQNGGLVLELRLIILDNRSGGREGRIEIRWPIGNLGGAIGVAGTRTFHATCQHNGTLKGEPHALSLLAEESPN